MPESYEEKIDRLERELLAERTTAKPGGESMKQEWDAPEWLRDLRGFPAYYLHSLFHWLSFALLPYAGDWAYRNERRAWRREQKQQTAS